MSDKVTKEVDIKVGAPGAEKVPGLFARIGHEIHEMNQQARQGAVHGFETIFRGAGAGAGIFAAAEGVKKLTEAMEAYASGQKKANEALDDFLKDLPIFGQVYEATHGVISLVTARPKLKRREKGRKALRRRPNRRGRRKPRLTAIFSRGAMRKRIQKWALVFLSSCAKGDD
jgi:hypothetical protein